MTFDRNGWPLNARDFVRIASGGFGDPQNGIAHSMAWFRERLYVGVTRSKKAALPQQQRRSLPPPGRAKGAEAMLPGVDQCGEIWRYEPRTDHWERLFVAPIVSAGDGRPVPREVGYRSMTIFHGPQETRPALYVSPITTLGNLLLRSVDGENFEPVGGREEWLADSWSFRSLIPHKRRLYTTPIGQNSEHGVERNSAANPMVLESSDPACMPWQPVSMTGFGDPTNRSIFSMATFENWLYAGTFNPVTGLQIWKTQADGLPYAWTQVIPAGAYRGKSNEAAVCMCPFRDALYIGTGIQGFGYDRHFDAGPAAAELIRLYPDDRWELIMGEPRRGPAGELLPRSELGPGFGNPVNSVLWQMAEHRGWLYAGTQNWTSLLALFRPLYERGIAARFGRIAEAMIARGAFELWRSSDGIHWQPITDCGFGNPLNYGVRTMVSTPHGLFLGTASISTSGHSLESDQAEGGCEIWLGRS